MHQGLGGYVGTLTLGKGELLDSLELLIKGNSEISGKGLE